MGLQTLIYEQEHRKESLIVLLYCRMTIAHGFLPNDAFDFALPHAVGLAEASQRLEQKRIGTSIPSFFGMYSIMTLQVICFVLKSWPPPTSCS